MKVIICENYEEMSKEAAKIFASQITLRPKSILGLATGSTPLGLYDNLVSMCKNGDIDMSETVTFNLDEYYPLPVTNPQSYRYFMNENLFSKVNINIENTFVPNGEAADPALECQRYENLIEEKGGIDIQLLGIGQNGHIGFNEPAEKLNARTHLTSLTENTIQANSRFFDNIDDVPKKALTMGMGSIMKAKKIVVIVSGKNKQAAVRELLSDDITTTNPATMLKMHSDVILICDKDAYGE